MKALPIFQPFAHLIIHGGWYHPPCTEHRRWVHKRVENRQWPTDYRGPLLIHAGKSREWLGCYSPLPESMVFGAIIGRVEVVECFSMAHIRAGRLPREYCWLREHPHAEGPYCHVYAEAHSCDPIPHVGRQKFFDVPDDLLASVQWTKIIT